MNTYFPHITKPINTLRDQWNGGTSSGRWEKLPLNEVRRPIIAIAVIIVALVSPILVITGAIEIIYKNITKARVVENDKPIPSPVQSDEVSKTEQVVGSPEIEDNKEYDARPIMEGGCDRFFDPKLFNVYRTRLKSLLPKLEIPAENSDDPIVQKWTDLKKQLNAKPTTREGARAWHYKFTNDLRAFYQDLKWNSTHPVHATILATLEEWMFNKYFKLDLNDVLVNEIGSIAGNSDAPMLDVYKAVDKSGKLKHGEDVTDYFDAHLFGNIPFNLPSIQLEDGHVVQMVRMPSVTKDVERIEATLTSRAKVTRVEIVEEFLLLLSYLKKQGKSHFYVNLMSRTDANEAVRTKGFEDLSNEPDSNLIVITLDKDSDFWFQRKEFAKNQFAGGFKEQFVDRLFDENGRYHFSNKIDPVWLKETTAKLMNEVHAGTFKNKDKLTPEDKQIFIEVIYCKLIEAIMMKTHPATSNLSCKHCIDRGAGQLVSFFSYMRQKGLAKIEDLFLKVISIVPSVLVSNRLTPEIRYNRLAQTVGQFKTA